MFKEIINWFKPLGTSEFTDMYPLKTGEICAIGEDGLMYKHESFVDSFGNVHTTTSLVEE